jgi:hypothetical protein
MLYRILLTILSIFVIVATTLAQRPERMRSLEKMEELRKIKLIEILEMDEETSIKFFTRRSEHMKKMEGLLEQGKEKIDQIEGLIEGENEKNSATLKKNIDEYLLVQDNIIQERQNFVKSASEILTTEQFAKFVVFEEQFRNEISHLLFRERNRKPRNN